MELNEYQDAALKTAVYPKEYKIIYPALKLAGEAGEVAEKVGKSLRGDKALDRPDLAKELGDVLWYIAAGAADIGYTLEQIANMNLNKLGDRAVRGVLKGDGDNR
ncbi:NTP pyrophosphatase (non-canonical NTP hydrolase) [Rhodoblastus acidophilus]|uniref:nucleoside triphosphate pyrophosphohydrolase family protein n=1 Tax=Rhodoblastus acidophilus TaxID=1074 RepID=UPI0022240223|nr:nucleoside triphosphate pyrophosphohydrolase family protein [Rhodoblastus acidophilus]MCW2286641.1 NTP pyrophosphatase (non-canonical NTP hydrolase) [Rhodoblastus acidophilus]MCW2335577.1 NTP pyrophosphatase (non-canonical NTP hydrolase) [Rhodoblastus acidophilus]